MANWRLVLMSCSWATWQLACTHEREDSPTALGAKLAAPEVASAAPPASKHDAAPPPDVPRDTGAESPLQKVVRAHLAETRACWWKAHSGRLSAQLPYAKVVIDLGVGATGLVTTVHVTQNADEYPDLADCLKANIEHWRFPASLDGERLQLPFVFTETSAP